MIDPRELYDDNCLKCGIPLTSDDYKCDRIENGAHTRCNDYWDSVAEDSAWDESYEINE